MINPEDLSKQVSDSSEAPATDKLSRLPRASLKQLTVQKVHPDGTIECQLVTKQKTISFKFNRFDTLPSDIIEGMIKEDCLKPGTHKTLTEQLQDIIMQLQENPSKVPESPRYVQKVCLNLRHFEYNYLKKSKSSIKKNIIKQYS